MIPKEKLRPNMILKYNASLQAEKENDIYLIVTSIASSGLPRMQNYKDGYQYGTLGSNEYFHKWNTPSDVIHKEIEELLKVKPR